MGVRPRFSEIAASALTGQAIHPALHSFLTPYSPPTDPTALPSPSHTVQFQSGTFQGSCGSDSHLLVVFCAFVCRCPLKPECVFCVFFFLEVSGALLLWASHAEASCPHSLVLPYGTCRSRASSSVLCNSSSVCPRACPVRDAPLALTEPCWF